MVRAKFKCIEKNQNEGGFSLKFQPVTSGSEENDRFFKFTPWGDFTMGTINGDAAKQFEVGKEYYLDFTIAQ